MTPTFHISLRPTRQRRPSTWSTLAVLLAAWSMVALCACGGSGVSGDVVATVGQLPITRSELNHWMGAVAGGDYFEYIGAKAPVGLVADPPNYARCVSAARALVPKSSGGRPKLTDQQLYTRCRQLYVALKRQALSLLISFAERNEEGLEQGIVPTPGEVNQLLARVQAEQFPTERQFQTYLSQRDWVAADELTQLKRNIISTKLLERFRRQHPDKNWPREYGEHLEHGLTKWTAKTSCLSGYVVPECGEHKAPHTIATTSENTSTSPVILLENLAAGR